MNDIVLFNGLVFRKCNIVLNIEYSNEVDVWSFSYYNYVLELKKWVEGKKDIY